MWGKILSLGLATKSSLHFFSDNKSLCERQKLEYNNYIKYVDEPEESECCKKCLKELKKIKQKSIFA